MKVGSDMNLMNRYSIRKYTNEAIKKEWIEDILTSMLLSPSGKNKKPWEFIYIDDKVLIENIASCKVKGASFVKSASAVILVLSLENESDTWIEDGAVALTIGHLKAHELGLGSCWIQVRQREAESMSSEAYVKQLMSLPDKYRVVGFLTLGMPDETPTREKHVDMSKVHYNKVGQAYE